MKTLSNVNVFKVKLETFFIGAKEMFNFSILHNINYRSFNDV
ncbi:hypothetical protein [Flavobacterium columnare]|nr:hypothetical protein [Flavobacterium columnare]